MIKILAFGFFDNMVLISLPDKSDSYTKGQGESVIRDFFAKNWVKDFNIIHRGDNNGSQFFIGNLQTKNGNYRTTFFLKQKSDKQVLQEIRFEEK